MTIEFAPVRAVHKPWGSMDLRPWSSTRNDDPVGELWFERPGASTTDLLLKLLFTTEPLSIQVHPTDSFAQSIGLAHGKSEAWVVLSAAPGAQVALGLKHRVTYGQLRAALEDGSILELVHWREVASGDVVFVPAGTIHAIGAGLVIAEIQQNIDATFRLYDHGRSRQLDIARGVTASNPGPAQERPASRALSQSRALLVTDTHFVLERIDLPANSDWMLAADIEVWLLVINGHAQLGTMRLSLGEAIFLKADRALLHTGDCAVQGLVAYCATAPLPGLLRDVGKERAGQPFPLLAAQP